ncbi:glucose 1-dehydrogenase [Vibrio penaeicida]|uniref:SDR family NAD(P)-dependent oxidoreductase n=1 Tax=Vibrio penaeicida TaxID=104609 RepID=UPI0027377BF2|nr:glucose 1-dehydrogenase [Vibrio penaeicida]MDP2571724.1 glucose 1-dehydrogenase [Vibrio penaeicida]
MLANKRVLVTGGSRGIGAEIARTLASQGAQIVINYHTAGRPAQDLVQEINKSWPHCNAAAIQADISDNTQIEVLFQKTLTHLGGVDILINNAAMESTVPAVDLTEEQWNKVIDTNVKGAFFCAQHAAKTMIAQAQGGVILNVSSIHETIPRLGLSHYCISKAGLTMMTKSLALEWAEHGIRVLGVAPGAIETEMNRDEITHFGRDKFESWIPLSRLGQVEDVANAIAFLISDNAGYISGDTLTIDGGYLLNLVRYDPREQ